MFNTSNNAHRCSWGASTHELYRDLFGRIAESHERHHGLSDSVGAQISIGELGAPDGCGEIIAAYDLRR